MEGKDPEPELDLALGFLPGNSDPTNAIVRQRAGVACFFARQALAAEEHSLQALWLCDVNGMLRAAARSASVLYGVHYHLTGDLHIARYYAEVATVEASAAGDVPIKRQFLIAQYDLAAVFAEWDRAQAVRDLLRRDASHEPHYAGTAARIADVLLHGSRGDFVAMQGALEALLQGGDLSTADHALVRALEALAFAGSGRDADARSQARRALGLSRAADQDELAHLTIRRKIAAVLAAYVSTLVGDVYHGTRALKVRSKWSGSIGSLAQAFASQLMGSAVDVSDPNLHTVKGYAVVANAAHVSRQRRARIVPEILRVLTHTEIVLLKEASDGKTNGEIARERGVTRNAVERRLMSAYEKLGVHTRAQAVAKFIRVSTEASSGSIVRTS